MANISELTKNRIDIRKWRDRFTRQQQQHIAFARMFDTRFQKDMQVANGIELHLIAEMSFILDAVADAVEQAYSQIDNLADEVEAKKLADVLGTLNTDG